MLKLRKQMPLWGLIIVSILMLGAVSGVLAQYQVGQTVSNFTLNDVNGNPVSLNNYQGEVILLNFFATW